MLTNKTYHASNPDVDRFSFFIPFFSNSKFIDCGIKINITIYEKRMPLIFIRVQTHHIYNRYPYKYMFLVHISECFIFMTKIG